ncbi:MAG TPA: VOC family protein [Terriglobales bacterium]
MAVKPVPDGYHTVTPYLTVDDASILIDFLKSAFNAQVKYEMKDEKGNIRHAEVSVGDSILMIGQARDEWKPRPMTFYLYVPDADSLYKSALAAGAKSLQEVTTQFYGDRSGGVEDTQGNYWYVATHVEDVSPEEMDRRMKTAAH